MKYILDTHTHSTASGHAYNTVNEMIDSAKDKGLKLLGITEHAPAMPGTCHLFYFQNLKILSRKYDDLIVLFGAEANIMDSTGAIDLPDSLLPEMDYIIASIHGCCIAKGSTIETNTNAVINAMKNPYINIIGHPDDNSYPLNYDKICKAALEYNVLLEVNNSSMRPTSFRGGARDNYIRLLTRCKHYGNKISLGTDAHCSDFIGDFTLASEVLKEVDFPQELIVNTSVESFLSYTNRKTI